MFWWKMNTRLWSPEGVPEGTPTPVVLEGNVPAPPAPRDEAAYRAARDDLMARVTKAFEPVPSKENPTGGAPAPGQVIPTGQAGNGATPPAVTPPAVTPPVQPPSQKVDPPVAGAPDKYEAFTAPEGVTLDQAQLDAALPIFKDLGLTQAAAQKLVSFQADMVSKANAQLLADWQADQDTMKAAWKADSELAPDDNTYNSNILATKQLLDAFGTPALRKWMDDRGLSNNPEFARLVLKMAKAGNLQPDQVRPTGGQGSQQVTPTAQNRAERMFPNEVRK